MGYALRKAAVDVWAKSLYFRPVDLSTPAGNRVDVENSPADVYAVMPAI